MSDPSLLAQIFEALPAPTFLVDVEVQVHLANRAARRLAVPPDPESGQLLLREGHVLDCVHASEHPGGCGRSEACRSCVLRALVGLALVEGRSARRHAVLELRRGGGIVEVPVLVAVAPVDFRSARLAVLTIEDARELARALDGT